MSRIPIIFSMLLVSMVLFVGARAASAQQLEPRAYSPAPVGANFLGLSYLYSSGGAALDPTLPIQNLHARVYTVAPYYGRTFDLLGRQASVTLLTPVALAELHADVFDVARSGNREGLADPALRFAVNLIGGPAMRPLEFARHKPETILGASLTVIAPFGQYDPGKLINLGSNRWSFKPELGFAQPVGDWTFELDAGIWLFTANNDFYGGQVRRQDPLASYQAHVVYNFSLLMWVAADYTYYAGGSTTISGKNNNDRQDNSRTGLTFSFPITHYQSLKLAWSRGVTTRVGTSFDTIGVTWQLLWF